MDNRTWLTAAVLTIMSVLILYKIGLRRQSEEKKHTSGSLPALSRKLPAYIGPLNWKMPAGFKPYKTTKVFSKDTIPRGLTSRHNTKQGVAALIHVITGQLELTVFANKKDIDKDQVLVARAKECAISLPQQWHKVAANSDDVKFYVEFWK